MPKYMVYRGEIVPFHEIPPAKRLRNALIGVDIAALLAALAAWVQRWV